jgi:hypothetical protein
MGVGSHRTAGGGGEGDVVAVVVVAKKEFKYPFLLEPQIYQAGGGEANDDDDDDDDDRHRRDCGDVVEEAAAEEDDGGTNRVEDRCRLAGTSRRIRFALGTIPCRQAIPVIVVRLIIFWLVAIGCGFGVGCSSSSLVVVGRQPRHGVAARFGGCSMIDKPRSVLHPALLGSYGDRFYVGDSSC